MDYNTCHQCGETFPVDKRTSCACHKCESAAKRPSGAAACSPSSLTPETDALADELYARGIKVSEIRMLEHARKMEKERNMARASANTFRQCAEVTFGTMPFPRKFHWENAGVHAPGESEPKSK